MTGGTTRYSTKRLWTGTMIMLLVITGPANTQRSTASNEAAPFSHSELAITDIPSGSSVEPLRKSNAIVDSPSTSLKRVHDVPVTSVEDKIDAESSDVDFATIGSDGSHKDRRIGNGKTEKLKIVKSIGKPATIRDKESENDADLSEFRESFDNEEIDDLPDDNDREPTTKSPIADHEKNADPWKNKSREQPIDEILRKKNSEIGISLVDDTNVNYKNKKIDKIPKDATVVEASAKSSKIVRDNGTNAIVFEPEVAKDRDPDEKPKTQIEVVRNSTLPKVMRISETPTEGERKKFENHDRVENVSAIGTNDSAMTHESNDLGIVELKIVNSTITNERSAIDENNNLTDPSHDSKGRKISFDGVNGFETDDNKTVEPVRHNAEITDRPIVEITEKSVDDAKLSDLKPYPYAKTDYRTYSSNDHSANENGEIAETTEETSALENTIGQNQQNEKIVVTEPSVVIDNSIQQFKSTDYKKTGNSSRMTASYDVTRSTTVPSHVDDDRRIESASIVEPISVKNHTNIFANAENDVPTDKDEAAKSKNSAKDPTKDLDLTDNGITDVVAAIKNDSASLIENSVTAVPISRTEKDISTSRATDKPSVQTSTNRVATIGDDPRLTNIDVQTDPEESMLKISPLNAGEVVTAVNSNRDSTNPTDSPTTLSIPISVPKITIQSDFELKNSTSPTLIPSEVHSMSTLTTESPVSPTVVSETSVTSIEASEIDSTAKYDPSTSTTIPVTSSASSNVTDTDFTTEFKQPIATTVAPERSADDTSPRSLEDSASVSPDDSAESTTSKIEYVFVGLTDGSSTTEIPDASSSTPKATTEPSTLIPTTAVESTTMEFTFNETTATTHNPKQTNTNSSTVIPDIDNIQDSTTVSFIHEFTDPEYSTTLTNFAESTTTTDDAETSEQPNITVKVTTEAVSVTTTTNSTDNPSGIVSDIRSNTTDTGRGVDTSTNVPEAIATNAENINATIIRFTEPTDLSIATEVPDYPTTTDTPPANSTPKNSLKDNSTTEEFITDSSFVTSSTKSAVFPPKVETSTTMVETTEIVTEDAIEIAVRGGVPSLVKVVFEGSWTDVCPHLDVLRQSLADLLTAGLQRTVLASQIILQRNACSAGFSMSTSTTILPITTLLLYVVDENGTFDSEMTKTLPTLYSKSPVKLQVIIRSFQLVQDSDSGNAIAVIVVSCVAFLCLVILAGLLFIMRKRQTRFNYGERCRPVSLDAYSLDSVSAYNSVRRKGAARASKISYGNPTFEDSSAIPSHPLNFAGLSSFCNEQNAIAEEFAGIPQVNARIDELPPGAEVKNRYANVVPLPETRVSLMKINNDPLTEYINASYVRGSKSATKYYIACQGPIESTVTDFWRMIWEQQSKVVIMLTDLVENGVEKCAEYLPPSEVTDCHRLFGDFQITLKKRETKEKYAISTLQLKNLENNTFREISHIWYLWPTNGVQSDAAGSIAVLLEARALQRGGPGPIVVHCSPGTGRTGTLIALDLGIRQYEITRTVDVPRVVYTIRRDRAGAVQTKEQYAFIYKALNLYATKLAGGALES